MASSWLNFFSGKKQRQKNWASYVTLSWRTNVRASKRTLTMYWPGWWRAIEPAQGHVAGSISAEVFFSAKKIERATRRWASYEALSQLRGTEPATWHWASYVALSQQGSFELARRQWAQWASKVALSFIIYIPMQSQPYNILNLGQNNFFWGRHVPLSWSGNVKSNIRFPEKNGHEIMALAQQVTGDPRDGIVSCWTPTTFWTSSPEASLKSKAEGCCPRAHEKSLNITPVELSICWVYGRHIEVVSGYKSSYHRGTTLMWKP